MVKILLSVGLVKPCGSFKSKTAGLGLSGGKLGVKLCCYWRLCCGLYIRCVWIVNFVSEIRGDQRLYNENGLGLPVFLMYDMWRGRMICGLQVYFYIWQKVGLFTFCDRLRWSRNGEILMIHWWQHVREDQKNEKETVVDDVLRT